MSERKPGENAWLAPTGKLKAVGEEHSVFSDPNIMQEMMDAEDNDGSFTSAWETRRNKAIKETKQAGYIRIAEADARMGTPSQSLALEIDHAPTEQQRQSLATMLRQSGGEVVIDFPDGSHYQNKTASVGDMMRAIDKAFKKK